MEPEDGYSPKINPGIQRNVRNMLRDISSSPNTPANAAALETVLKSGAGVIAQEPKGKTSEDSDTSLDYGSANTSDTENLVNNQSLSSPRRKIEVAGKKILETLISPASAYESWDTSASSVYEDTENLDPSVAFDPPRPKVYNHLTESFESPNITLVTNLSPATVTYDSPYKSAGSQSDLDLTLEGNNLNDFKSENVSNDSTEIPTNKANPKDFKDQLHAKIIISVAENTGTTETISIQGQCPDIAVEAISEEEITEESSCLSPSSNLVLSTDNLSFVKVFPETIQKADTSQLTDSDPLSDQYFEAEDIKFESVLLPEKPESDQLYRSLNGTILITDPFIFDLTSGVGVSTLSQSTKVIDAIGEVSNFKDSDALDETENKNSLLEKDTSIDNLTTYNGGGDTVILSESDLLNESTETFTVLDKSKTIFDNTNINQEISLLEVLNQEPTINLTKIFDFTLNGSNTGLNHSSVINSTILCETSNNDLSVLENNECDKLDTTAILLKSIDSVIEESENYSKITNNSNFNVSSAENNFNNSVEKTNLNNETIFSGKKYILPNGNLPELDEIDDDSSTTINEQLSSISSPLPSLKSSTDSIGVLESRESSFPPSSPIKIALLSNCSLSFENESNEANIELDQDFTCGSVGSIGILHNNFNLLSRNNELQENTLKNADDSNLNLIEVNRFEVESLVKNDVNQENCKSQQSKFNSIDIDEESVSEIAKILIVNENYNSSIHSDHKRQIKTHANSNIDDIEKELHCNISNGDTSELVQQQNINLIVGQNGNVNPEVPEATIHVLEEFTSNNKLELLNKKVVSNEAVIESLQRSQNSIIETTLSHNNEYDLRSKQVSGTSVNNIKSEYISKNSLISNLNQNASDSLGEVSSLNTICQTNKAIEDSNQGVEIQTQDVLFGSESFTIEPIVDYKESLESQINDKCLVTIHENQIKLANTSNLLLNGSIEETCISQRGLLLDESKCEIDADVTPTTSNLISNSEVFNKDIVDKQSKNCTRTLETKKFNENVKLNKSVEICSDPFANSTVDLNTDQKLNFKIKSIVGATSENIHELNKTNEINFEAISDGISYKNETEDTAKGLVIIGSIEEDHVLNKTVEISSVPFSKGSVEVIEPVKTDQGSDIKIESLVNAASENIQERVELNKTLKSYSETAPEDITYKRNTEDTAKELHVKINTSEENQDKIVLNKTVESLYNLSLKVESNNFTNQENGFFESAIKLPPSNEITPDQAIDFELPLRIDGSDQTDCNLFKVPGFVKTSPDVSQQSVQVSQNTDIETPACKISDTPIKGLPKKKTNLKFQPQSAITYESMDFDEVSDPFKSSNKMRVSPPPIENKPAFQLATDVTLIPENSTNVNNGNISEVNKNNSSANNSTLFVESSAYGNNNRDPFSTPLANPSNGPAFVDGSDLMGLSPCAASVNCGERRIAVAHDVFSPPANDVADELMDVDEDELFSDPAAIEYLLNRGGPTLDRNHRDLSKESLFVKFDPLVSAQAAKRYGVHGALPFGSKTSKELEHSGGGDENSYGSGLADSCSSDSSASAAVANKTNIMSTGSEQALLNLSLKEPPSHYTQPVEKPTQVVTPAINRSQSQAVTQKTPPSSTQKNLSVCASPALSAIERLISLTPSTPPAPLPPPPPPPPQERNGMDPEVHNELVRVKELWTAEVSAAHARQAEQDARLIELEKRLAEAEDREKQSNQRLKEVTAKKNHMSVVVEEYERSIASLVHEREATRRAWEAEKASLARERDEATQHLAGVEHSFNDVHAKYERSKAHVAEYKANVDGLKRGCTTLEETLRKQEARYDALRQHAMGQIDKLNQEMEVIKRAHDLEVAKQIALRKKSELTAETLQENINQKNKENEHLTDICNGLIQKMSN